MANGFGRVTLLLGIICVLLIGCAEEVQPTVATSPASTVAPASQVDEPNLTAVPAPTSMAAPTASAIPTPTPTAIPVPTAAPRPTVAPVPVPTPTAVPAPTAIPEPTATPTPTPPPRLDMPDSKRLGNVNLEKLFDEIIAKTERREAFSEIKETNIGFSAIEDMKALRDEFLAAETELELYYALIKLSNTRRDRHLRVNPVDGGLEPPVRQPCVSAPIYVLPEISDVYNPAFFVVAVGEGVASPQVRDVIVGVNGRSMEKYIEESALLIRHSTLPGLY